MRQDCVRAAANATEWLERTWTLERINLRLTAYGLRLTACDLRLATYGWLLLGQAMQGAQTPHQIHCTNADHRPVAEQPGDEAKRSAVVRIVERRRDNRPVGDVEIGITQRNH